MRDLLKRLYEADEDEPSELDALIEQAAREAISAIANRLKLAGVVEGSNVEEVLTADLFEVFCGGIWDVLETADPEADPEGETL